MSGPTDMSFCGSSAIGSKLLPLEILPLLRPRASQLCTFPFELASAMSMTERADFGPAGKVLPSLAGPSG